MPHENAVDIGEASGAGTRDSLAPDRWMGLTWVSHNDTSLEGTVKGISRPGSSREAVEFDDVCTAVDRGRRILSKRCCCCRRGMHDCMTAEHAICT